MPVVVKTLSVFRSAKLLTAHHNAECMPELQACTVFRVWHSTQQLSKRHFAIRLAEQTLQALEQG
jgi:hypothetical protein